jgi:hypothetical protein
MMESLMRSSYFYFLFMISNYSLSFADCSSILVDCFVISVECASILFYRLAILDDCYLSMSV